MDTMEGVPVTILDSSYNSVSLEIGKHLLEIRSEGYCLMYSLDKNHVYQGGVHGNAFFKILYEDNQLYLHLLDMINVLTWSTKNSNFENLMKAFEEDDKKWESQRIGSILHSCYQSLCFTRSYYSYKNHIEPHLSFLKEHLNNEATEYKWIKFLDKLNLKFIADALGK